MALGLLNTSSLRVLGIAAAAVALVVYASAFVVTQTEQALVLQFGKPVRIVQEPGLKFKVPFIQSVTIFSKQLLDFNAEPKEVIASDQKRLIVDAFVRYQIKDPLLFYQTVRTEAEMRAKLNAILDSSLRQVIGGVPLSNVISADRTRIMRRIRDEMRTTVNRTKVTVDPAIAAAALAADTAAQAEADADTAAGVEGADRNAPRQVAGFGIEILDVRIMRADLPEANSLAVYRRMQTEREREAKEFRAQGAEEGQRIRARADRDRTVLLAEARREADTTRGQGDADAARIAAAAYGRDAGFYDFYRTLEAYRHTLRPDDTTLILSPSHPFLRQLGAARGR